MARPSYASTFNCGACERSWDINVGFTGNGAAVMTAVKTRGLVVGASTGVTTKNTRQGVGLYTLYIDPASLGGTLAGFRGFVHTAATVAPQDVKYVAGSLNRTTGAIQIEVWSAAGALADPPSGAFVDICIQFFDNLVGP